MEPCPFCKKKEARLEEIRLGWKFVADVKFYHFLCNYCGARGPAETTPEAAERAWDAWAGNWKIDWSENDG